MQEILNGTRSKSSAFRSSSITEANDDATYKKQKKLFFIEKCYLHNYSKLLITEAITKHENNQKSVHEPDKYKKLFKDFTNKYQLNRL